MKVLPFLMYSTITVVLVFLLHTTKVLPAPLGKLLSPQHGVWQNAESADTDFSANLKFSNLKGKVDVYFDERLVPHVFAEQEQDVYFVQGYLHAKFRLWQMELQTFAAAGRAAEIIGAKAINHDREFRRLGMVYAAEISLKESEKDPLTKMACDAYTAGVNEYIKGLKDSQLPLEYKLIGYKPELWSNLKTALFLKYMSYDLAGYDDDFEMTNAKNYFSKSDFDLLYPLKQDSLNPIIPKGTIYSKPSIVPKAPEAVDSLYFNNKDVVAVNHIKPNKENGSNNWAVSGKKTKSGSPILCNDPHLGLNLPSLWYEMQLSTPTYNAYGATFPGAPSVIIGYNDSCAFGFTNGGRDVKDYYAIKFKDDNRKEYWFNNEWKKTDIRIETIKVKDSLALLDTVAYTVFGPVMFDKTFSGNITNGTGCYALRWTAHDPSNELKIFTLLNRAKNYTDYSNAVTNLHTPGQNCVFACKNGDIAIRAQGNWPAKWQGQGDFIMPGTDSSYMWQGMIPMNEVPFQYNPERGYVSSANQKPTDSSYPYYLGRNYPVYRGLIVNKMLDTMQGITPQSMMAMQTSNYNVFAAEMMPLFLKNLTDSLMTGDEKIYFNILKNWNLYNEVDAKGASVFSMLWQRFYESVYDDEFTNAPKVILKPFVSTLADAILHDSAYKFLDNIQTTKKETLKDDLMIAFKNAVIHIKSLNFDRQVKTGLEWANYKGTSVNHLTKLAPFSRLNLPIGGGLHNINAATEDHGPSWRMVVSLTENTEAYGIYPGGQSGNPGSKYYDNFIDNWAAGKYYSLWMMKKTEATDKRVKWHITFNKA